jgi:hypothetical protein
VAIRRSRRIVFLIPQRHAWIQSPCVPVSFSGSPGKRSVPCSFDLTSSDKGKVADVTVLQAEPGAMGQIPPVPIGLGFLILIVLDTTVCKSHYSVAVNTKSI